MMRCAFALALTLCAGSALADAVVPVRTIRPGEVITAEDLQIKTIKIPGALNNPEKLIGQEARIALYPGRPVRAGDIGPPALVDRNQLVTLVYRDGSLRIAAEGRALGRGAQGELVRVMNLASRATVTGTVSEDGTIRVD